MKSEKESIIIAVLILIGIFTVAMTAMYLNHLEIMEKIKLAPKSNVPIILK